MWDNMAETSIFNFLNTDDRFKIVYNECVSFEKEIIHESYTSALRTGRAVSEILIKFIINQDNYLKNKLLKIDYKGKIYYPDLYSMINESNLNHVISDEIQDKYHKIRIMGNACAHGENFDEVTFDEVKKVHKYLFDISIDCYHRFNEENDELTLSYSFDLNYLNNENKFTQQELIQHDQNIIVNEVSIDNLKNYIGIKQIFVTLDYFKEFILKYQSKITNGKIYEKILNSIESIDEDTLELILENFEESYRTQIFNELKDYSQYMFKDIDRCLENLNQKTLTLDIINKMIEECEESHEKEVYNLIYYLSSDLIKNYLHQIIKERKNIPVSFEKENHRIVVDAPNYEIVKKSEGYSIEQTTKITLDDEQKEAVTYNGEKPLVINAGPGSGKTRVIIERVVFLVKELKKDPSSILVITFTRKAASELKDRLKNDTDLGDAVINKMRISTVHSFCRYLISTYEHYPYNFLVRNGERGLFILANKEELGFIHESFIYDFELPNITDSYNEYFSFGVRTRELVNYLEDKYPVSYKYLRYMDEFYADKDYSILPMRKDLYLKKVKTDKDNSVIIKTADSYPKFNKLMDEMHYCDNNYLLKKANDILENEGILNNIQYNNILIDEFQDTDHNQMKIFDKLLNIRDTFTIVGDSDQSIYGWRGAYPEYFEKYLDNNKEFKVVTLRNNYRSTRDIVEFNELLISDVRSFPKEIHPVKKYKIPIFHMHSDKDSEYVNIISMIKNLKNDEKIKNYSDIVVLFRSNQSMGEFIQLLHASNIPYYLKDHNDLIFQNEIKAILTLFWYLMPFNPHVLRYREDDFLNLYGFTDEKYKSSDIFKLSDETMNILANIQRKYDNDLLAESIKPQYINLRRYNTFKSIWYLFNERNEFLERIVNSVGCIDIASLNREELIEFGIESPHDLNFFLELKKLKDIINDKSIKNYNKPTTLQLFYKLISITGYLDKILLQKGRKAKKIKLNISLISQIIKDFEDIMGKYEYSKLFNYLNGVVNGYGCPINEFEDDTDKVHLMTVHKSKGLEYPVVFLASLEDNSFPIKYKKPVIPNEFFEYKPQTLEESEKSHYDEEYRTIYVATTRAKELLILSSRHSSYYSKIPSFLSELESKYDKIQMIEPYNVSSIPKVESSRVNNSENFVPQIEFEKITRDFLFCPTYYDIVDNSRFRNSLNNDNFIDNLSHNILFNNIFIEKDILISDIENILDYTINLYKIKKEYESYKILKNILEFWKTYGQNYDILKSQINLSLRLEYCDLNGIIDLIIKENDDEISIVQFISSDDKVKINKMQYEFYLHYYYYILQQYDEFKDYKLKNIIVHSLVNNKKYEFSYNVKNEVKLLSYLNLITENIVNEKFKKTERNCKFCPYATMICKTR